MEKLKQVEINTKIHSNKIKLIRGIMCCADILKPINKCIRNFVIEARNNSSNFENKYY
jgi:hypothetical protein